MAKHDNIKIQCPSCNSLRTKKDGHGKSRTHVRRKCNTCGKRFTTVNNNVIKRSSTAFHRVILISDTHCGHNTGLTPTNWQNSKGEFIKFQRESWLWFTNTVELFKPFDTCIANGDLIDGRQDKSGGAELVVGNRLEQAAMATEVLRTIKATNYIITRGTPYHTGKLEEFEDIVAKDVGAEEISDRAIFSINGYTFDVRHKVGNSSVPYGGYTSITKEKIWNKLKSEERGFNINCVVRSHIHQFRYAKDRYGSTLNLSALQGSSKFGTRECSGGIDYGLVIMDIGIDGRLLNIREILPEFESTKDKLIDYGFNAKK